MATLAVGATRAVMPYRILMLAIVGLTPAGIVLAAIGAKSGGGSACRAECAHVRRMFPRVPDCRKSDARLTSIAFVFVC